MGHGATSRYVSPVPFCVYKNLASYLVAIDSHCLRRPVMVYRFADARVVQLLLSFWCYDLDPTNNEL